MYIDFSGLITGEDLSGYTYPKEDLYTKSEADARFQIKGEDVVKQVYVDGESVVDDEGIAQIWTSGFSAGVEDVKVDGTSVVDPITKEANISISGKTDGVGISTIRKITVSQYSGLTAPDPNTLYVVVPDPPKALRFSMENPSETNTLSVINYRAAPNLEYSLDGGDTWETWDYSAVTFGNGVDLYVRGMNPEGYVSGESEYYYSKFQFGNSANTVNCTGNVMHLIDYTQDVYTIPSGSHFHSLFDGCKCLATAPELPATGLTSGCYRGMFANCSSLTTAPELPATTLASYCYSDMFNGCTSLTTAPELPATTLGYNCYYRMFKGCTSLTQTPELPATTLASYCYYQMFSGCANLTTAPSELPAITLANSCYQSMFSYCSSLTTAPELPATTLASFCYDAMFYGCTSLTTAPVLPSTTLATYCYQSMFYGCTGLTSITANFEVNTVGTGNLGDWVKNVSPTGVFHRSPNLSEASIERGVSGIPTGWTVDPPF